MEILADVRNPRTQRIATQDHAAYRKNAAADVEKQISRIGHFCGAGHGRTKGADNRNKSRQDHSPAAVLLIKIMRALQVAAAKEKRVFPFVEGRTCAAPNPVAQ